MFEMWPAIREGAQAAGIKKPQLHFAYSPIYFAFKDSGAFPHLKGFHARLERLEAEAGEGLVNHGSLSQPELAKLFRESMVWSYPSFHTSGPCPFPEISCIGAKEAQAAGCIPVTLEYGALTETVVGGDLLDLGQGIDQQLSATWKNRFSASCVHYLSDGDARREARKAIQERLGEIDWSGVVDDWQLRLLTSAKTSPAKT